MTKNMNTSPNGFSIDDLVDDLQPVSPIDMRKGFAIATATTVIMAIVVFATIGFRQDLMAGRPDPMFFIRLGTLLLLAIATGFAALSMGRPSISTQSHEKGMTFWKWALAGALVFPLTAFIILLTDTSLFMDGFHTQASVRCLVYSVASSVAIGGAMTLWMRGGAPTNLTRAGMLIGLSAGSFGAAAYSFACPYNAVAYNGVWFPLAVAASTVIGTFIVPRLIRW